MPRNSKHKSVHILSPMATGNGAYIVHKTLESRIPGYQVIPYNPYRTLFPPSLFLLGRSQGASLIHTTPDYAIFHLRKKVPLIVTFHNYVLDLFMQGYSSTLQHIHYQTDLKIFTQLAVAKNRIITSVSRFIAELVRQEMAPASNIKVIYNGVDHTIFTPRKPGYKSKTKKVKVLFCGNLSTRKGAQWLLPIVERLAEKTAIFYTSGLRTSGSLAEHSQLQCLEEVPYQQMPGVYQDADILLFPTVREGFPLAGLEAMSCGLPVVATDCSSIPELVDHGKGGFLCPVGDVEAFAEKINLLADSPGLRKEMGEYNRAKVEKMFTVERMVREYKELFEEVLDTRKHQRY